MLLFNRLGSILTSREKCDFFLRKALGVFLIVECTLLLSLCFSPARMESLIPTGFVTIFDRSTLEYMLESITNEVYCDEQSNLQNILEKPLAG